ncbi:MAG: hypothetical protein Q7T33_06370 [Dehalococcoidia bacterium]|nr:hypothetical protein [Dehalococcoidia bacterium]
MTRYILVTAIGLLVLAAALVQSDPASASFHCMRIHAVLGGFNGDNTIQYVELRMNAGGQGKVGGFPIKFYPASGDADLIAPGNQPAATFTFPQVDLDIFGKDVPNESTGDSILIATAAYNLANTGPGSGGSGGEADFVFTNAGTGGNTSAATGFDPEHPIQSPSGKITFAEGNENCTAPLDSVVDSVAYGGMSYTGPVDFGTAALALPSPSDNRALRLGNLNLQPSNNSAEYSLQATSGAPKTVAMGNLGTDLDTPRNNLREVATLEPDADGDGVPDGSDQCPSTAPGAAVDTNGCSQPQVDGDLDGACNPSASSPLWCTGTDTCPSAPNAFQANEDGDSLADACDPDADNDGTANTSDPDDDNDGVYDTAEGQCRDDQDNDSNGTANDGCPQIGAAEAGANCQNNTDNDADGYVNDGCPGATETNACGSNPFNPGNRPERLDGAFAASDEDGDTVLNEALPSGSSGFDCDGDGWVGNDEMPIFAAANTAKDQDPCGNNGWPFDLDPSNSAAIGDINSFIFPLGTNDGHGTFAYYAHTVPDAGRVNEERWDLEPNGIIGIGDINALNPAVTAPTARPPMFGGQPAFFAGACPWPP